MPSKKFIIVVLAILLLGAGAFWLSQNKITGNKIVFEKGQGVLMPLQQNNSNSDWEQVLERTSIYSGVDKNLLSNQVASADSQPVNETEKFSQNFLSKYLAAIQTTNGNLDDAAKQNIIDSMEKSIDTSAPAPAYKFSDLNILDNNSNEALKNYGNKLGTIFKNHLNPEPGTEVYTFRDAVKNNDQNKFEELGKSAENYQKLFNDCLILAAPSAIKDNHLQLVNNLKFLKDITLKLQNFPNDPVGSMTGINQYADAYVNFAASLVKTDNYFKSKGISFSKNDGWYFIQTQLNEK